MRRTPAFANLLVLPLLLLTRALCACGPSCPATAATRAEWPTTVTSGALRVELGANQLAQTNAGPAHLPLSWSKLGPARLVVTDDAGVVRLRQELPVQPQSTGTGEKVSLVLADASGAPLPSGLYRVAVHVGDDEASATFEIVHCALYY